MQEKQLTRGVLKQIDAALSAAFRPRLDGTFIIIGAAISRMAVEMRALEEVGSGMKNTGNRDVHLIADLRPLQPLYTYSEKIDRSGRSLSGK